MRAVSPFAARDFASFHASRISVVLSTLTSSAFRFGIPGRLPLGLSECPGRTRPVLGSRAGESTTTSGSGDCPWPLAGEVDGSETGMGTEPFPL